MAPFKHSVDPVLCRQLADWASNLANTPGDGDSENLRPRLRDITSQLTAAAALGEGAGQGEVVAPRPGHDSVAEAIELATSHALHGLPLSHEQHVEACAKVGRLAVGQLAIEHGCPVHSGAVHGGEAQELRKGIEAILELANDDDNDVKDDLQQLLDRVDAGDSLAHMEWGKRGSLNNTTDTKKRLLRMIERYGTERAQEALAGSRDARMDTLKRHSEQISKALADIGAKIDKPLAAVGDLDRALSLLDMARSGKDLPDAWADEIDMLKERHAVPPEGSVLKVPLSVEGHLGATWDSLDRVHHQQAIGIATAKSELAIARVAGHLVIHDSIVHTVKDAKDPTPGEPRHASLLHWALMTHDLTCALGHLASMASRIPRGTVTSLTECPILDLAVAAVAFTIQLTIETEDHQDALELRALERKLIASMDRRDG